MKGLPAGNFGQTDGRVGGFTCLPNWLFGQATAQEMVVILALQFHAPSIHPSLATLARESGLCKSTVCLVISALAERGWLRTEQRFGKNGGNSTTVYHLLIWPVGEAPETAPQPAPLVPEPDNPLSDSRTTLVRQPDNPCPTAGHKQDQSNNKTRTKPLEPPLPPTGGTASDVLFPLAALPKDPAGATLSTPPPPPPTKPVKPRPPRFQPSQHLIPPDLFPVHAEILGFWATKAGARSQQAWNSLMTQLRLIQSDPHGGTDALRAQLQTAIDRAPIKPWMSVTHALWRTYGLRPQSTFSRRQTPEEAALESIAFIKARDAKRAAAAAANSQTLPCEVLA